MCVLCIPVSLPGLARHAVLITEHAPKHAHPERASRAEGSFPTASFPRPAHLSPLLSRQQPAWLTPLAATLTKNRGGGPSPLRASIALTYHTRSEERRV